MIEGIAWTTGGRGSPVSRDDYIGPSWSWASYDDAATYMVYDPPLISKALDWHVELKHAENPFGEVTSAWIRIQGPVAPLRPSLSVEADHEPRLDQAGIKPRLKVRTPCSEGEGGPILELDHNDTQDWGEWTGWDMQVLLIYEWKTVLNEDGQKRDLTASDANKRIWGLAIRREGAGKMGKMQRVGTATMNGQEAFKIKADKSNWETILLV